MMTEIARIDKLMIVSEAAAPHRYNLLPLDVEVPLDEVLSS